MAPPLGSAEVVEITRSLKKRDYSYKCHDQPMCGLCDRPTCLTRKYGVGGQNHPVIRKWTKLVSEEPTWTIEIEGSDKPMEIDDISDITNYRKFTDQCAKQLNRFFAPMKQGAWAMVLQEKESELQEAAPPADTTSLGHFSDLLEDYLTDRARAKTRDEVLGGKPWEDEETDRHLFRMKGLHEFVTRSGMRNATRAECMNWIRQLGGNNVPHPTTIKGKSVRLWWVPGGAVSRTPPREPHPEEV
jgi:hypothetical protein